MSAHETMYQPGNFDCETAQLFGVVQRHKVRTTMWPNFRNACLLSLAGYSTILLMGFWFALFTLPFLQAIWTAFCAVRLVQLVHRGGHKSNAPAWDRESYGFALGGLVSSVTLFVLVALTPIRVG
jgi:hypothetical protein